MDELARGVLSAPLAAAALAVLQAEGAHKLRRLLGLIALLDSEGPAGEIPADPRG